MKEFDFWTSWGVSLDDRQFANALTALGILMARSRSRNLPGSGSAMLTDDNVLHSLVYDELKCAAGDIPGPGKLPTPVPWQFPSPESILKLGAYRLDLSKLDPAELANAWQSVADNIPLSQHPPRLRLRVLNFPSDELIRPWFRMLFESDPASKTAYIDLTTPFTDLYLKWPLRLGFFPGNSAEKIVRTASTLWPSNKNSSVIEIGRDYDNCDILVFDGSLARLLKTLKDLPVPMKCNMFIIRGPSEDSSPSFLKQIRNIASLCSSNGLVFIKEGVKNEYFPKILNRFMENLCHNMPMDASITEACSNNSQINADPLIFLSNALASFSLDLLMKEMIRNLKKMPARAKINIPEHSFKRINISVPPAAATASAIRKSISMPGNMIRYDAESTGATGLSEINKSVEEAILPVKVENRRRERYISARTFIMNKDQYEEEKRAFLAGTRSKIIMRIGPQDEKWVSNKTPVPIEKLPRQKEAWRLTVVLSEPSHVKKPLRKEIKLPKDGPSTECEFIFTPEEEIPFEGRITVLHRGRVLQTAVVKMPVVKDMNKMPQDARMELTDLVPVRAHIGDLDERRQFDLALVTNHTTDQRPHLTAIASEHAWLVNLESCKPITEEINNTLSEVAFSIEDYSQGLESEKGTELLKKLVFSGCELYNSIVEAELMRPTNKAEFARKEYLQIVSTRSDSVIPFEFIYDREVPNDDAKLCTNWKIALKKGKCEKTCTKDGRETICPLGFWGLSKVIERHEVTPEFAAGNPEHLLQSEAITNRSALSISGTGLFAASAKVDGADVNEVTETFKNVFGIAAVKAGNWEEWEELVKKHRPRLIVALTHTDGTGANASLEIGDKIIKSIQIRTSHVRPDERGDYPVVALLGCDTSGSAIEYGKYVQQFRLKGAGIVIGTIATVFGGHAAKVAGMLIKGLTAEGNGAERLGEVMRSVKRKALLDGLLMALCVVAFGDADWKLTKKEN